MPFVRKNRSQVLVVHNRREADGRVVQDVLHRFESPASIADTLAPLAWREWTQTMAWTYPDYEWPLPKLRARLEEELERWSTGPGGGAERRKQRAVKLLDELAGLLGGLAPSSATDADLLAAAGPGLRAVRAHVERLLGPQSPTSPDDSRMQAMQTSTLNDLTDDIEGLSEAEQLFDEGMEHWWVGDRTSACRYYRAALRHEPDHVDAKVHIGLGALHRGRVSDAAKWFQAAAHDGVGRLRLHGTHAPWSELDNRPYLRALSNLALARARQRRYEEALVICERILELNPGDNQGIRYRLGELHHRLGRWTEAIECYTEAADYPDCAYSLAFAQHQLERPREFGRALLAAFAVNRYVPPMLLGLPWERVDGLHGSNWADTEVAAECVHATGDLWRKDRTAGALLRHWWSAPQVQAWIRELDECAVALGLDGDRAESGRWIARREAARKQKRIEALLRAVEVDRGLTPER